MLRAALCSNVTEWVRTLGAYVEEKSLWRIDAAHNAELVLMM